MFGFKRWPAFLVIALAWALQNYTFGSVVLWYTFAVPLLLCIVYALGTYDHEYWEDRGVFSPPGTPFLGHIKSVVLFKEQGGLCFKRIYDTYKDLRFLGTHQFYQRTLVIRDTALIKRICVTDFQHFVDRGFFFRKDVDPLAGSVVYLRGQEWRKLRSKISPVFSSNKLRGMLPLVDNTAKEFLIRLKKRCTKNSNNNINEVDGKTLNPDNGRIVVNVKVGVGDNEKDIDARVKDGQEENIVSVPLVVNSEKLAGGYTADAIVPCAFGIKSNVMDNEKDPFAVSLHAFYELSLYNIFEKTMRQFWPTFVLFFRMRIIPKKTHDFFYNIVMSVMRARETGEQEKRGDFIDIMMALRNDDLNQNSKLVEDDVEITDMVIAANAFIIFLGGYETTSSTLAFLLMELAERPDVQERIRKEVAQVMRKHGDLTYEALQDLTYIDMVIQETLRLYPPFPSIQRMCTKDYVIPGTNTVVEEGTIILFPTLGIQRDEQYFERAEAFDPDRWSEDRPQSPPGAYMPFGDGPRYCLGKRFATIQMKCCLARVMPYIQVSPAPGKPARSGPMEADPRMPLTLHPRDPRITISLL